MNIESNCAWGHEPSRWKDSCSGSGKISPLYVASDRCNDGVVPWFWSLRCPLSQSGCASRAVLGEWESLGRRELSSFSLQSKKIGFTYSYGFQCHRIDRAMSAEWASCWLSFRSCRASVCSVAASAVFVRECRELSAAVASCRTDCSSFASASWK